MSNPTLEQQRAQDAWNKAAGKDKDYVKAAKSLPALIMNSGLLQALAFCQVKGNPYALVAADLRSWLAKRIDMECDPGFDTFMGLLMAAKPDQFQAITTEAFAWLRWLRQMASARNADRPGN